MGTFRRVVEEIAQVAEIIAARGGETVLVDRLVGIDTRLDLSGRAYAAGVSSDVALTAGVLFRPTFGIEVTDTDNLLTVPITPPFTTPEPGLWLAFFMATFFPTSGFNGHYRVEVQQLTSGNALIEKSAARGAQNGNFAHLNTKVTAMVVEMGATDKFDFFVLSESGAGSTTLDLKAESGRATLFGIVKLRG